MVVASVVAVPLRRRCGPRLLPRAGRSTASPRTAACRGPSLGDRDDARLDRLGGGRRREDFGAWRAYVISLFLAPGRMFVYAISPHDSSSDGPMRDESPMKQHVGSWPQACDVDEMVLVPGST